jgi:hypothetical protein
LYSKILAPIGIIILVIIVGNEIYSQQQSFEEFMEWCVPRFEENCSELYEEGGSNLSETRYDFVIIILVIIIGIAILGNYLWSKRKGRQYSEE